MADASGSTLLGWEAFFEEASSLLRSAERQEGVANMAFSHYVVERLQICISSVTLIREHLLNPPATAEVSERDRVVYHHYATDLQVLTDSMRAISQQWEMYIDQLNSHPNPTAYRAPLHALASGPGRPRFEINQDQLEYLASLSFSWMEIAAILGVSRMTIWRRRQEFEIIPALTNLNDEELLRQVREMRAELPQIGESIVCGRLRSMGFRVQRQRVRED